MELVLVLLCKPSIITLVMHVIFQVVQCVNKIMFALLALKICILSSIKHAFLVSLITVHNVHHLTIVKLVILECKFLLQEADVSHVTSVIVFHVISVINVSLAKVDIS